MNRSTGTGHLTKDPKFPETESGDCDLHAARACGLPRDLS